MAKQNHHEFIADRWHTLLKSVKQELPAVVSTVIEKGGTRPVWQQQNENEETFLMAYPAENFLRAGVILKGEVDGKLNPLTVLPLIEGMANADLVVEDIHPWKSQVEADIAIRNQSIDKTFWAYNPLFFRDKSELQIGKVESFLVSGLVTHIQKAMLDDLTITQGPQYEEYSMNYLAANPDKSRLDVPPLKISLAGQQIIGLGKNVCEYQARIRIMGLNEFEFEPIDGNKVKMYGFLLNLATDEEPMLISLYASEHAFAKGLVLEEGMDVDLHFWLQARMVD